MVVLAIVDLGATKTVIGSELVPDLLQNLRPEVMKQVKRCPCEVTFRFGNHGVLQSKHAIVVPIHGMLLKIAIVPGNTPFLLSNTLLRALGGKCRHHQTGDSRLQDSEKFSNDFDQQGVVFA